MMNVCSALALRSARLSQSLSLSGLRAFSTSSRSLSVDDGHIIVEDKPSQGKHGRPEHAFAPHHCQDLETLSQMDDVIRETEDMMVMAGSEGSNGNGGGVNQSHTYHDSHAHTDFPDSNYYDSHSNIDLHCVMQSTVPEPVNTNNKAPSHVNMPGGGQLRNDKYVYDDLRRTMHPSLSRKYHTIATKRYFSTTGRASAAAATPSDSNSVKYWDSDEACPQGIQGDDCVRFKLWLENCRKYGLQNCDQELQGIQMGRKTLSQIFQEQDILIEKIAAEYRDQFSHKKKESESEFWDTDIPCPQGLQGEESIIFKLWLENCRKYGLQNCDQEVQGIQAGRKTLSEVISEQDKLIREIAEHYKKTGGKVPFDSQKRTFTTLSFPQRRHYCTRAEPPKPESDLTQVQKLQRAVRDYGSTVMVFHISLSLASLGGFYVAVSS